MNKKYRDVALTLLDEHGLEPMPIPRYQKYPVGLDNWNGITIDRPWVEANISNGKGDHGVGIRLHGPLIAVDIDIMDKQLAKAMLEHLAAVVGDPLVHRIGQAPKFLVPLACPEITKKISSKAYLADGKKHQIEILTDGEQYIAYGLHQDTREPYKWINGDLTQIGAGPEITREEIEDMISLFEEEAKTRGWTVAPADFRTGDRGLILKEACEQNITSAADFHQSTRDLAVHLALEGMKKSDSIAYIRELYDQVPADMKGPDRYDKRFRDVSRLVKSATKKYRVADATEDFKDHKEKPKEKVSDYFEHLSVTKGYVQEIETARFLYPDLVVAGNILTVIAESGAGKTTFFFKVVAPHLVTQGYEVYYIDCDSPPQDHQAMYEFAIKKKFRWVNPVTIKGESERSVIRVISQMIRDNTDLKKVVFIFDTLKKFVDLMSKESVKGLFKMVRKTQALGATNVLLAHANKKRDRDGLLVFEGTGDVKSDSDDLIFFEFFKSPGFPNHLVISTVCDQTKGAKNRGIREPFSFTIDKDREVTMVDYVEPPDRSKKKAGKNVSDGDVAFYIRKYLDELGEMSQTELVSVISHNSGAAQKQVIAVAKGEARKEGSDILLKPGSKNAKIYYLDKGPQQGDLF